MEITTIEEAIKELSKYPPSTKIKIYNKEAWKHTPIKFSYFGPDSNIDIKNELIVESSVYVTYEDYD